jgi:dUTP diphosphatase
MVREKKRDRKGAIAPSDPLQTAQQLVVTFEPLYADVVVPERATSGAAGYDVRAHLKDRTVEIMVGTRAEHIIISDDTLVLQPNVRAAIPLGFRAMLPSVLEAQLRLRSSIAFRKGLVMPNAPATVDSDYPGEWVIVVANMLSVPVEVKHLERLAQIVFARFEKVNWKTGAVTVSSNRGATFGSTGQ